MRGVGQVLTEASRGGLGPDGRRAGTRRTTLRLLQVGVLGLMLAAAYLGLAVAAASAASSITEIAPTATFTGPGPVGLSDEGLVAGNSGGGPFTWTAANGYSALKATEGSGFLTDTNVVTAVSPSGQVVGYARNGIFDGLSAIAWPNGATEATEPSYLACYPSSACGPNLNSSTPAGVNASGAIVGTQQISGPEWCTGQFGCGVPTRWPSLTGAPEEVGSFAGGGIAINASGAVLSNAADGFHVTTGAGESVITCLGQAFRINASETVIGETPEAHPQPALWSAGKCTTLPLLASTPESAGGVAAAINDAGLIVGRSGAEGSSTAVEWNAGKVIDLNTMLAPGSGWVLEEAFAVNASGEILGVGKLNGEREYFLLAGQPNLSIGSTNLSEPASGSATANFPVTLSSAAGTAVTVEYTTEDGVGPGGAKSPGEYTATHGTLTFAPGETAKTIPVEVLAAGFTGVRTFTVKLSNPEGANLETGQATGTILGPNPLQVTVSISPSKLEIEQNEAGAVPLQPKATVTVKNVSKVPLENVALPAKLTIGWHGPAPINALPVSQIAAPSAAELQVGTLEPGESKPLQYTLQVEGDGQFDIESLVTGSEAGTTVKALGRATIEPTSQLLVMKNTLGAVVHSQENPSLIKAGTHFLVKVVLENRSYVHRLQIDPYEAELSGNAHGGSLIKEGEPTTYEAPTGSLDEVKAPAVIVLAPRESRGFFVVVGTSGSNAFAQKGVGGGTRATVKFPYPEVSTLNSEDKPTAAAEDDTVLTPGSGEFQVGVDDSAAPQAPVEAWKPSYYVAKGVVLGWWDLTWGALKGLPDLGVLAFQNAYKNNPGVFVNSLAKGTIDEMYYLTELWGATSADPAARQALVQAIQGKVETAFSDALWLLPEKGAALYDTVNNAVGAYFTNIANNWSAGNWEQALTDMSETGTVAAGTVGPEVYRIAAGVLTRLAPAAEAWKAEVAADTTRTTDELEVLSKPVEPELDALKGVEEAKPGYEFSLPQMRKFIGMTAKEVTWLSNFVRERKLSVVLRSRAEESIEWLEKGAYLKPSLIKSKNVSWLDANFLGYNAQTSGGSC